MDPVANFVCPDDTETSLCCTFHSLTSTLHEGEMYKTLLSYYEARQRELVLENAELRKVLQQIKKDMVSILSSRKPAVKSDKREHSGVQATSEEEEEEVFDSSKESVELYCFHTPEKLTNSIRLQWGRFKSHVERLDSQASLVQMVESKNTDAVPQETQEEEMDRLKLEIQQCKDFIPTQQQLLQQLSSPCDEETASLLSNCYMLQEKEHLKEEWKIFERERKNFAEAANRLSHERWAFEEDRATWLTDRFLKLSPFADSKKTPLLKSAETEAAATVAPEKLIKCPSDTASPTPSVSRSRQLPPLTCSPRFALSQKTAQCNQRQTGSMQRNRSSTAETEAAATVAPEKLIKCPSDTASPTPSVSRSRQLPPLTCSPRFALSQKTAQCNQRQTRSMRRNRSSSTNSGSTGRTTLRYMRRTASFEAKISHR
ncbi:afadin- and alpha-actinin-binding protein-like isoform X4 [Oreochromis aureus]|uniref:afadin- and alpha-actinin-binding protein-like isoform X4 n=1 Tax=Oreochromis aureus TaxID=47969 RepID=UPI001954D7D8|nr:afadin- and alpha-actinin-binding protein-like isoform X4 [Oreochromis aureus]